MQTTEIFTRQEALDRVAADRALLADTIAGLSEDDLTADRTALTGPLGDFCASLRDLVAHVSMWDEINLAVLSEARAGRVHWSLEPRWERPAAGTALNKAGVAAGQQLPVTLVVQRFHAVRAGLLAELRGYSQAQWSAPLPLRHSCPSIGALAQYVMTAPGVAAYWHAAAHLGAVPVHPSSPAAPER